MLSQCRMVTAFLTLTLSSTSAAGTMDWSDPRYVGWSEAYLRGEVETVLDSVEADLASAAPHPSAALAWVEIHDRRGTLHEALGAAPEAVRDWVEPQARLKLASGADGSVMCRDLVMNWEEEALPTVFRDPWLAHQLAYASADCDREDLGAEIAMAALQTWPDHFGLVWFLESYSREDQRVADRVTEALEAGGELDGSDAGTFLAQTGWHIRHPMNEELEWVGARVAALAWLEAHPEDPYARRFLGHQVLEKIRAMDRALEQTQAAHRGLAFRDSSLGDQLEFLERIDEAEVFVAWEAGVSSPPGASADELERVLADRRLDAVRGGGWQQRAWDLVDAARTRWPDDPRFAVHEAWLATTKPGYGPERDAWLEVERLGGTVNLGRLITALAKSGRAAQALTRCEALDWSRAVPKTWAKACISAAETAEEDALVASWEQAVEAWYPGQPSPRSGPGSNIAAAARSGRWRDSGLKKIWKQGLEQDPTWGSAWEGWAEAALGDDERADLWLEYRTLLNELQADLDEMPPADRAVHDLGMARLLTTSMQKRGVHQIRLSTTTPSRRRNSSTSSKSWARGIQLCIRTSGLTSRPITQVALTPCSSPEALCTTCPSSRTVKSIDGPRAAMDGGMTGGGGLDPALRHCSSGARLAASGSVGSKGRGKTSKDTMIQVLPS